MPKLIIDISEEDFNEAKILFSEGVSNNIEYAVAHGKPYEETPKGDLISREALKKAIERTFDMQDLYLPVHFLDLIDNAPTVEPKFKPIAEVKFDKEQLQEIVDKAKAEVLASIERPQGEWIYNQYDGNPNIGNWHCSICHSICCEMKLAHDNFNFCPNCGAQMVGGGENE